MMNNLVNVTIALSDKMGLSILLRRYLFRKQIHNSRISHKSIVLNFFNYPDFDLLISFTRNKFFETFHHLRAKFTDVVLRNFDFSANYDSLVLQTEHVARLVESFDDYFAFRWMQSAFTNKLRKTWYGKHSLYEQSESSSEPISE